MECQPFDVRIDGAVHQPDRILHEHGAVHQPDRILYKCLVLGVAHTGRIYGAPVVFGESLELLIDDRLVAVAAGDGGLQVVRDYGHGGAPEEMQRVLAGRDEVFLALGPDSLAIGVVAAWQDGYEHFDLPGIPRELVNHLKPVTREVDVHLVARVMLHMSDSFGLKHVPPQQDSEIRVAVTVRVFTAVFPEELADRNAPLPQAGGVLRKKRFQFDTPFGRLPCT